MKVFLLVIAVILLYGVYSGVRFYHGVTVSKKLVSATTSFTQTPDAGNNDHTNTMLVIGDSTAYGVGATHPKDSLPGRVAQFVNAQSVENYAVSGAVVTDLAAQIIQAKQSHYSLILIQIGANDVVRFHSAKDSALELQKVFNTLPDADHTVMLMAGDLGDTKLLPSFLNPFYRHESRAYHEVFAKACRDAGVAYVNLYDDPSRQMFHDHPEIYLAADGFHPSSAGYELWFEAVKKQLSKNVE